MNIHLRYYVIGLFLLGTIHSFSQTYSQKLKVVSHNRFEYGYFGNSSAIDGNYAIIGEKWDGYDAQGANIIQGAGSAHIYEKVQNQWIEKQKLVPLDRLVVGSNDSQVFGFAVAISGNTAVVTTNGDDYDENGNNQIINAGSAYIFERNVNGVWEQKQKICALDRAQTDYFGNQVAIAGNYIIIACSANKTDAQGLNSKVAAGAAYIFEKQNNTWGQVAKLVAPIRVANDNFGFAVSISSNGVAAIGAYGQDTDENGLQSIDGAGAAYIYTRDNNGTWQFTQKLISSDRESNGRFGMSIDISDQYCVVGADLESEKDANNVNQQFCGAVYVFTKNGNLFEQPTKIVANDRFNGDSFGRLVRISDSYILIGATVQDDLPTDTKITSNSGSAYIYQIDNQNNWNEIQQIKHDDPNTGDMLGLNGDISGLDIVMSCHFIDYDVSEANYILDAGAGFFFTGEFPCIPTSHTIQQTACISQISPSGKYVWTISDTYKDTIPNVQGCDSVITVELTIKTVDIGITENNKTLQANAQNAEFVWLNVTQSPEIITNEITSSYAPLTTGMYAVEVTQQGCTDTSEAMYIEIIQTNIDKIQTKYTKQILQDNSLQIVFPESYNSISVDVISISGQKLQTLQFVNTNEIIIPTQIAEIGFFLKVQANNDLFTIYCK